VTLSRRASDRLNMRPTSVDPVNVHVHVHVAPERLASRRAKTGHDIGTPSGMPASEASSATRSVEGATARPA
jgi:hypothetical protein